MYWAYHLVHTARGPPPFPSGFRPPLDTLIRPRTPKERLRPEMEGGHEKKM